MKKTIILIFLLASIPLFANNEPQDTENNGYRNISTLEQLRWVSENDSSWSWNFELDNDIDAEATKWWNWRKGWEPIGNSRIPFSGNFNGNGFAVRNLHINRKKEAYIGFWGIMKSEEGFGIIQNFDLINCKIKGNNKVGTLAGFAEKYQIFECSVKTKIKAEKDIGGLIGTLYYSCIKKCSVVGDIKGYWGPGGFIGDSQNSKILQSYANTNIEYCIFASGFIFSTDSDTIKECYSKGSIQYKKSMDRYKSDGLDIFDGESSCFLYSDKNSFVYNCYSQCIIENLNPMKSDIPIEFDRCVVKNSYFWEKGEYYKGVVFNYRLYNYSEEITDIKETLLKTKSTYTNAGWDFETIWDINPKINDGYPFLRNVPIME